MIRIEEIENKIINEDCLNILKQLSDKSIDLILTDPPYGVQYARGLNAFGNTINNKIPTTKELRWDIVPTKEVFEEIIRVSKNAIIFGGNYFTDKLPVSKCWIVWDKIGDKRFKNPFADVELAWTNFTKVCKKYVCVQQGFVNEDKQSERIHPTQKPLKLFEQILQDYSNENDLVLDCFSGSGTTAIACSELKRNFICIEKDKEYFEKSVERLNNYNKQLRLF